MMEIPEAAVVVVEAAITPTAVTVEVPVELVPTTEEARDRVPDLPTMEEKDQLITRTRLDTVRIAEHVVTVVSATRALMSTCRSIIRGPGLHT